LIPVNSEEIFIEISEEYLGYRYLDRYIEDKNVIHCFDCLDEFVFMFWKLICSSRFFAYSNNYQLLTGNGVSFLIPMIFSINKEFSTTKNKELVTINNIYGIKLEKLFIKFWKRVLTK